LVSSGVNFYLLKTRINVAVFILWICYVISYFFAPYVRLMGEIPYLTLDHFNKIILFYFISVVLIDDLHKAKWFSYVIILAMIHLTFWGNMQYFTQNWAAFNSGRLMGPTGLTEGGIYRDENTFAMFFVTAIPFLFYFGLHMTRKLYRYLIWAVIPLGWHAIFLTGSRGGLVGLGATLFAGVIFSKNRKLGLVIIPLFVVAFQLQGGHLLQERTTTIIHYKGESSAETRIQAWKAAFNMVNTHPFTGVGPACFVTAMGDFSDKRPRATHSVPFQFAAEIGVLGFLAYCYILYTFFRQGIVNTRLLSRYGPLMAPSEFKTLLYLNESTMVSFFGLSVCSLFLSLNYYEIFYFLLIIFGLVTACLHQRLPELVSANEN
jgi:probable O-glycosylation ligase (exosortase A-associated)